MYVCGDFQDCAGVILYTAEAATKVALDAIQILGKQARKALHIVSPINDSDITLCVLLLCLCSFNAVHL